MTGRPPSETAEPDPKTTAQSASSKAIDDTDTVADTAQLDELKRRALDVVDVGVVIAEATGDTPTVFANEGFGRLTGYDPEELLGRNCRLLQGEGTDERPVTSMRERIDEERPVSVVLRNYRKDGTEFWNEVEISPVHDDTGEVTHFIGFQRDVTERKGLQIELEAAQRSLRQLYTVTTDTTLSFRERVERTLAVGCQRLGVELGFLTRLTDGNQTVVHSVGDHPLLVDGATCPLSKAYCRRTIDEKGLVAVVHAATDEGWADDPGYERFGLECYLGGKVTVDDELYGTLCFADVEPRERPFTEAQTAFVELLTRWVSYELERRRRERELRVADRRFRSLFENPMTFAAVLDPDGTLREVNDMARSTLDGDSDAILGRPFWETPWWTPSDDSVTTVEEAVETAASGRVARFECDYFHRDGTGTATATLYPVYDVADEDERGDAVEDEVVSLMALGADTTTQTEQAAQLKRQRDRLEEFASVVSHDLRSPLEVARGRLQLHDRTGDPSHIDAVEASLDRMSTLIDDLLSLARQGKAVSELESTRVSAVARQAWNTVATPGATLDVTLHPETVVESDPGRLQQLFENLFRNCVEHGSTRSQNAERSGDAIEHGSTDATLEPTDAGEPAVTVRLTELANGDRGFAVEDDGPGIDPDAREYVFDRGFSTGDDSTGFGLAIVRRVVEAHGWDVRVTAGATGGARFEVCVDP